MYGINFFNIFKSVIIKKTILEDFMDLNKYIQKFNFLFPNIRFEIISKSSIVMVEMLEQKSLDTVIDNFSVRQFNPRIKTKSLKTFTNCFVVSKQNAKNFPKKHSLNEIVNSKMIVPNIGSYNRTGLEKMLKTHNIIINPLIEVSTIEMMLDLINRNMGVSHLIKEIILDEVNSDKYTIFEFDDLPQLSIHMLYIQEHQSFSSRIFIDF
jgi:DNA-binding transcriptional LysR family regulator